MYLGEGPVQDCAQAKENPSAVSHMLVTTSPTRHVTSSGEGKTIYIRANHEDAMRSPQRTEWLGAEKHEQNSLQQHDVYDMVRKDEVPSGEK